LQIFRARKISGKTWSEPEEIRELNSDMDELLPYFDPIEDDLYFASNGREGIGGFDLFRSHYDRERDEWSEPINLGFPINSAMDEYLLLPGSDLGMMMFFSSRQGTDSTVTVYRVHISEPKQKTHANKPEMLKEIACLGGAAQEALADLESVSGGEKPEGSIYHAQVTAGKEPGTITGKKKTSVSDQAYQAVLSEALKHQAASDSLKDLVSATRIKIRQSDDPNDRWVWQKQIMVWEKKACDRQEAADLLYARMKEIPEGTSSRLPEPIEVDTVIRDITVYRYAEEVREAQRESGNIKEQPVDTREQPRNIKGEPGDNETHETYENSDTKGLNRFDILQASPYDGLHPIPLDVRLPAGVFYRIQLGAFSGQVSPDVFGGLSPITGESMPGRGLVKYYAGKFSRYEDASFALSRIRSAGYEDAFIVAWYNGKQVSTQRAKQLE